MNPAVGQAPKKKAIDGAPVLPDDSPVNGFASFPVPDNGRFTLVCDADGGDVAW